MPAGQKKTSLDRLAHGDEERSTWLSALLLKRCSLAGREFRKFHTLFSFLF
jgi:hypothetical protein